MKTNPKHIRAMKDGKAPLEYLIMSVDDGDAWVMKGGADKYGIRNWLIDKILGSTYEGAIRRHFKAWAEGQDIDPDSGYHHFHHIRACCAIVLDAMKHGQLIDDRDRKESIDQNQTVTEKRMMGDPTLGANLSGVFRTPRTMADYNEFVDILEELDCTIRAPRDAGTQLKCIVQFTKLSSNNSISYIIATYGPFKNYHEAKKYVKANQRGHNGVASICTLTSQHRKNI